MTQIVTTFDEYQQAALNTALPSALDFNYLIPGLAAEAGELAGKYAKIVRDKGGVFSEEDDIEMRKEAGDVLWFVALIAEKLHYNLSDVAQGNIDKLESRKARGVIGGSGDNR